MPDKKTDFSAFTESGPDSEDVLGKISKLIFKMVTSDKAIALAELELKKLAATRADIAENLIPELMEKVHMKEFAAKDCPKIEIKKSTFTSIAKARKGKAIEWLDENNHGGIVKREVVVAFNKCDEDKVKSLLRLISKGWPDHKTVLDVNGATVKALITKLIEEGVQVPFETFGVHQVTAAVFVK